ncbi:MAG: hypothetical protein EOP83_26090 [Verrucomicrobiaceae bacterium]|nr:MAG: hypothetical protein EOP83_26090 [Verrucomicrobiaceae bacterium]
MFEPKAFVDNRSEAEQKFAARTIESEGFMYTHSSKDGLVRTEFYFHPEDMRTGSILRRPGHQTAVLREINP